ncbi:MAG: ribbon-helix-helix protein, CopG family [Propionibacteriaceae bacterium]|jgi:hypothetical protein|nr:ribbon-helix-helix protein, CopG family [Propionibacteriaceae bacterium]
MNDSQYTPEELAEIQRYADEAERGYDTTELKRRGRPRLGPAARSVVLPVRVTPELVAALDERRDRRHQTRSEAAREVLEEVLVSA